MTAVTTFESKQFQRILARNVFFPLGLSLILCGVFVGVILYLLNTTSWVDHTDEVISAATGYESVLLDSESGLRGFLLSGEDSFLQPYVVAQAKAPADAEQLRRLTADNPAQLPRIERIEAAYANWKEFAERAIRMRRERADYASLVRTEQGKRQMDVVRAAFAEFLQMEHQLKRERLDASRSSTWILILAAVVATAFFGGALAIAGRRELIGLSRAYGDMLRDEFEHRAQLEERDWMQTGVAMVAERVQGELSMAEVANRALAVVADRMGAAVGAIYKLGRDKRFERIGTFAFSNLDHPERRSFAPGEGLPGQVALDGKLLHLPQVPSGYLDVRSGLARGSASQLVLAPLKVGGQVAAVVELGTLERFETRHLRFLEAVSDMIAVNLRSARYRAELEGLLEETRSQAEELQSQQEELRVANEELESQARVLRDSQARLEESNTRLEEQTQSLRDQTERMDQRNRELRQLQSNLEEKARELEQANRDKSEFLANMSHELRTPLNSSQILIRLLAENKERNLTAEQLEFIHSIDASSNDLLGLINDILDLSKVEAGKLDIHPETVAVSEVLQSLRRLFEGISREKKVALKTELAPGAPSLLTTDRMRLEQILKNLVSNALKFTEKGSVTLSVSPPAADGRLEIAVIDTGIGIPADKQKLIFEAFHQADGTINRRYGGTGLGLTISSHLAKLLGGEIALESAPGKGSTFRLRLPLAYAGAAEAAALGSSASPGETSASAIGARSFDAPLLGPDSALPAAAAPVFDFTDDRSALTPGGRAILVVEDDPVFAKILFNMIHEQGFQCLVAGTATDAVELARRHLPSGVMLDLGLPDGSGLAVLDTLKEDSATRHIPVHIVSGAADGRAALEMGAIGFLRKPAQPLELKRVVRALEAKITQPMKHLLVIEDDRNQAEAIRKLIGNGDVKTTAVGTGAQALTELRGRSFDCIVMDLDLPDMNGEQLLERMSAEEIAPFPPVIVYTGRALTREDEEKLLRHSRTIVIKGAHSPERLLNEVTLFLHRVEARLPADRQEMLQRFRGREKLFEGRRVLVVDDDVRNIFALTRALEQRGASVIAGRNGREALAKLDKHPDIDLVLMDIMMPEMDGYEAMTEIRRDPRFGELPIIAVTARAMRDDQERALQAGANDFLAKPIVLDKLLSLIRVWMPKQR